MSAVEERSPLRSPSNDPPPYDYGGVDSGPVEVAYHSTGEHISIKKELLEDEFCGLSYHDIVYVVSTGCCGTKPKEILHSVRY